MLPDVRSWSYGMWLLHAFGALFLVGFFTYYAWFRRLEARARRDPDDEEAAVRFNKSLHGFPNAFYAKQFGLHGIEGRAAQRGHSPQRRA